jgi:hypothetical protein
MERRDLYEDDLTDERQPTPAQRDDVARTQVLDPDATEPDLYDYEDEADHFDGNEEDA